MSSKIRAGVLGATGMVGQHFIHLLSAHPWFEVSFLAASSRSAGLSYAKAVEGRWQMHDPIPSHIRDLKVHDVHDLDKASAGCTMVFSAVDMEKEAIAALETAYAKAGFAVVSNNSAHRWTADVPVIIPEVNPEHLEIIPHQRVSHGWEKGFITVKSNCSIQSYTAPLYALIHAGFSINKVMVTTLQALSGAGYPGVSGLDIVDNIVPFIKGEEEKSETEPCKVLGTIQGKQIINNNAIAISAHCNRVPVLHGHTACVSIGFADKKPSKEEIVAVWNDFKGIPQELSLPSAPVHPIVYRQETDRPQPLKDRNTERAMAVTVGRLRPCNILDYRFVGLHHNAIRGAAGGSVLTAELLKAKGYLG